MYMIEYSKEDIPLCERFRASAKLSGEYIIEPLRSERFTFRFVWSGSHDTRLLRQRFVLSDVILWMELTDICLSRWELLLQITVKWTRGTVLSHVFVMERKFYSVCWREVLQMDEWTDEWYFYVVIKLELLAIYTVGLVMIGPDVIVDVFLHFAKWGTIWVFLMLK